MAFITLNYLDVSGKVAAYHDLVLQYSFMSCYSGCLTFCTDQCTLISAPDVLLRVFEQSIINDYIHLNYFICHIKV